jgi:hypothetical protein
MSSERRMPDWASGDENGRLAEWAGVGRHKLARAPRGAQGGTSMPQRSYDPACLDLAEFFLEGPEGLKGPHDIDRARRLAQRIQNAIDAFLYDEAADAEETE